jgi:hypothetical protein
MRFKPPTMLRKRKVRNMFAAGAVLVAVGGLVLSQTVPAHADPTEELVAVGSDTIQDFYNGFSLQLGANTLGSYNATDPVLGTTAEPTENVTPVDGFSGANCSFLRPNGSGPGVAALELADAPTSNNGETGWGGTLSDAPQAGCVDIARSSSAPSAGNYSGPNAIQYVPFAIDAVAGSTGPTSFTSGGTTTACAPGANCGPTFPETIVAGQAPVNVQPVGTAITDADDFTVQNLIDLYVNCTTTVVNDGGGATTTYWPLGDSNPIQSGQHQIDMYIPQAGSGTEKFWLHNSLGDPNSTTTGLPILNACDQNTIANGPLAAANDGGVTVTVEEHDGTAVSQDEFGYFPFSIAQYIAQTVNNIDPRAHSAVLHSLTPTGSTTPVAPFVTAGQPSSGLNTNFPFHRNVFSVVSLTRLTNTSDPLNSLLLGSGSQLCSDKSLIVHYGFALMGASCGENLPSFTVNGS